MANSVVEEIHNKLQWLPQRPVYNYFHCEFRFWRNPFLRTIPYSLWYHMFRGQQTRSLNIGCLAIPNQQNIVNDSRCRIKLSQESREWEIDVELPTPHHNIFTNHNSSPPPTLYEICRRNIYRVLANSAKKLSTEHFSIYDDDYKGLNGLNNLSNLRDHLQLMNIDNDNFNYDLNGNNLEHIPVNDLYYGNANMKRRKDRYVPMDIIDEHFSFLPNFMKQDLGIGPVSMCENAFCKMPVFDYAFYELCAGKIILIDSTQEVVLSAAFCSKACANAWRRGKTNLLLWRLL